MKKYKKIVLVAIVSLMTGMATTFALLSHSTDMVENIFTSERTVDITLREPAWDGFQFGDEIIGKQGTVKNEAYTGSETLGLDMANTYLPGDAIPKNPTIKASGLAANQEIYAAIQLEFIDDKGKSITYEEFTSKYGTMTFNTAFKKVSNESSLFMLTSPLKAEATSPSLFEKIVVNKEIALVNGKLPSFKVNVTGLAVQANNVTIEEAEAYLLEMAK